MNGRLESEREDIRSAVRGEFTAALDSLASDRTTLLNQVGDLRLKLAEVLSQKEAEEKKRKQEAEEEAAKIHTRLEMLCLKLTLCSLLPRHLLPTLWNVISEEDMSEVFSIKRTPQSVGTQAAFFSSVAKVLR